MSSLQIESLAVDRIPARLRVQNMLAVANLEVVYNEVVLVLRGLSIEVPDGSIVALLGANGAGKTTTVRAITGLLDLHEGDITKGSITWNGTDISGFKPSRIVGQESPK